MKTFLISAAAVAAAIIFTAAPASAQIGFGVPGFGVQIGGGPYYGGYGYSGWGGGPYYGGYGHADLPLKFHPAAARASADVTPLGAMSVPA